MSGKRRKAAPGKKDQPKAGGIPVHCAHDAVVEIGEIQPNPRNPNQHPTSQIDLLAKVIREQGWRAPITVSRRSGLIVRGHGRLLAAQKLGTPSAPVDWQDYDSDEAEWADLLADNRIAELAEMDRSILKDLIVELDTGALDMDLTGFDFEALEELMTAAAPEPVDLDEGLGGESPGPTVSCPKCGFEFAPKR